MTGAAAACGAEVAKLSWSWVVATTNQRTVATPRRTIEKAVTVPAAAHRHSWVRLGSSGKSGRRLSEP
jgi:hypothetical protein